MPDNSIRVVVRLEEGPAIDFRDAFRIEGPIGARVGKEIAVICFQTQRTGLAINPHACMA
jgi:hypothetical protein